MTNHLSDDSIDWLLEKINEDDEFDISSDYRSLVTSIANGINNLPHRTLTSLNGKREIQDDILIVGSNKVEIENVLHIVTAALRELRMSGEYNEEICDKNIASRLNPKPKVDEPEQQSEYLIKSQGKYLILKNMSCFPSTEDGLLDRIKENWCVVATISPDSDRLPYFKKTFLGLQIDSDNKRLIQPGSLKKNNETANNESPSVIEAVENFAENYFISSGDFWRIKFNGDREYNIKASVNIRTLVEFISHPNQELNLANTYLALHGEQGKAEEHNEEGLNTISLGGINTDEAMEQTEKEHISKAFRGVVSDRNTARKEGNTEKLEHFEAVVEKYAVSIEKQKNGHVDRETGMVSWHYDIPPKYIYRYTENATRHLTRASRELRKIEGLEEHLLKYLLAYGNTYKPPKDFQEWKVTI